MNRRWMLALSLVLSLSVTAVALAAVALADDADPTRRFTVRAQIPELAVASEEDVEVIVEANNAYKLDKQYAASLTFIPEVGDEVLVARKQRFSNKDASFDEDGKSMTWTIPVTAKKRGTHPVNVDMSFQVCDDEGDCHVGKQKLRLKLVVKGD